MWTAEEENDGIYTLQQQKIVYHPLVGSTLEVEEEDMVKKKRGRANDS